MRDDKRRLNGFKLFIKRAVTATEIYCFFTLKWWRRKRSTGRKGALGWWGTASRRCRCALLSPSLSLSMNAPSCAIWAGNFGVVVYTRGYSRKNVSWFVRLTFNFFSFFLSFILFLSFFLSFLYSFTPCLPVTLSRSLSLSLFLFSFFLSLSLFLSRYLCLCLRSSVCLSISLTVSSRTIRVELPKYSNRFSFPR